MKVSEKAIEKNNKLFDHMTWTEYQEQLFLDVGGSTEGVLNDPILRGRVDVTKKWIGKGKKVLDIAGCWGGISAEIMKQGNEVTLLDLPRVLKKAKETHPELKFLEGSALDIQTEEQFDVVVATEIIEHILDLKRFFGEIKRVLKDDGGLILSTPNVARPINIVNLIRGSTAGWEYYGKPINHCRHFTLASLVYSLRDNGFKVLEVGGAETNIGMDWTGFTQEEADFLIKLIEKFHPYPAFRSSILCILCKKTK